MYLDFYGLKEKPFSIVPDTAYLFKSRQHTGAYNHLIYGISAKEGFMLITGDVGTGKTTLCRALLNELSARMDHAIETVLIFNPPATPVELLQAILRDLVGMEVAGATKKDLLDSLNHYLLACASAGRDVVVIIDEAQDLSGEILEEVRLLSNLETEKHKLLQIILVGQNELLEKLSSHSLRQLFQRISIHYHLTPLSQQEVESYVKYRLLRAGSHGEIVFTPGAMRMVYRYSRGIPRMIHQVCDKALLAGYVAQKKKITERMVREALNNTVGAHARPARRPLWLSRAALGLGLGGILLLAAAVKLVPLTGGFPAPVQVLHELREPSGRRPAAVPRSLAPLDGPAPTAAADAQQEAPADREAPGNPEEHAPPAPVFHKTVSFDSDGIMRSSANIQCAGEALATILKLRGIPEEVVIRERLKWLEMDRFSFHDNAAPFKLNVSMKLPTLEQMQALQYPCIVALTDERFHYGVLSEIGDTRVVILDPRKGKRELSVAEFERIWTGQAFYVCKDMNTLQGSLQKVGYKPNGAYQKEL